MAPALNCMKTTNNFVSMGKAIAYFDKQGIRWNKVMDMVDDGSIIIGPPVIIKGEFISCENGRYSIHPPLDYQAA